MEKAGAPLRLGVVKKRKKGSAVSNLVRCEEETTKAFPSPQFPPKSQSVRARKPGQNPQHNRRRGQREMRTLPN